MTAWAANRPTIRAAVAPMSPSVEPGPKGRRTTTATIATTVAVMMFDHHTTRRRSNRSITTPMNGDSNV
jgi:hypothetical protein